MEFNKIDVFVFMSILVFIFVFFICCLASLFDRVEKLEKIHDNISVCGECGNIGYK